MYDVMFDDCHNHLLVPVVQHVLGFSSKQYWLITLLTQSNGVSKIEINNIVKHLYKGHIIGTS